MNIASLASLLGGCWVLAAVTVAVWGWRRAQQRRAERTAELLGAQAEDWLRRRGEGSR